MKKVAMKVELQNDNPFTGESYYEPLSLPATEYEIRDALQRVRMTGRMPIPDQISIYDCRAIPQLDGCRLDSPTLDELNFLAKRLVGLNENEQNILNAMIPLFVKGDEDEIVSIKDLINLTYGLDSVSVLSNITNDEQLGEFVIESGMQEDVASIPENALYLLDKKQIGKLQRAMDGGVYSGNLYVCTDHFEMPKVYDGISLPEEKPEPWFAFRLLVDNLPDDEEPTVDSGKWISLPMTKSEMHQAAGDLDVRSLTDCVYYDFESSIPQIDAYDFSYMQDIMKLNEIAIHMAEMSPEEQIKFKAVLEAEKSQDTTLDDIKHISTHLHQYEISTVCDTPASFFKEYLLHHLDAKFDARWLNDLYCRNIGERLLANLGATVTDYGVISARGRSLYELVPFEQELSEQLETQAKEQEEDQGMTMQM